MLPYRCFWVDDYIQSAECEDNTKLHLGNSLATPGRSNALIRIKICYLRILKAGVRGRQCASPYLCGIDVVLQRVDKKVSNRLPGISHSLCLVQRHCQLLHGCLDLKQPF